MISAPSHHSLLNSLATKINKLPVLVLQISFAYCGWCQAVLYTYTCVDIEVRSAHIVTHFRANLPVCLFVCLFVCLCGNLIFNLRSGLLDCSARVWTTELSPAEVASIFATYLCNTRLRDPDHPSLATASIPSLHKRSKSSFQGRTPLAKPWRRPEHSQYTLAPLLFQVGQ